MKDARLMARRKAFAATLALTAAMAVGAVAASGAQALTWHHNGKTALSGSESESVAGSGTITVNSTVAGLATQFGCSATTTSGSIAAGGGGSSTINLAHCVVSQPSGCKLTALSPLRANINVVQIGSGFYQKFTPAVENVFGSIEFAGSECPLSGAVGTLSGSFAGSEGTSEMAVNRTLSFTKSEPWPEVALKLGHASATMTGNISQHLSGIMEGAGWRPFSSGWEVETGSAFASPETVEGVGGPIKFNYTLLGAPVSFTCGGMRANNAVLVPGGTESIEEPVFSACKAESPSTCELAGNSLTFEPVTGTLVQVNGKVYEKFTPVGAGFARFALQGANCSLAGLEGELTGSVAALGPEFGAQKTVHSLEFSDAANEATGSKLKMGKSEVHLSGSLAQALLGIGAGTPWGVFN